MNLNRLGLFVAFLMILTSVRAQDAKQFYEKGLDFAQRGDPKSAISFFDKSIELKSDEYLAWYNRAVCHAMMNDYEDALPDFEQTIRLSPGYKKAYLNRGTAKKHLTDYDGAMSDYNLVLKLDSMNSEAYYYRGLLFNLLGKRIQACLDFERSMKLGYTASKEKMDRCYQRPTTDTSIHSILHLTHTAISDSYGFTEGNPVKVGNGPEGGPANARMYLDLLRDANGKAVTYTRVGPCCAYESKHALLGKTALQDKYEITYTTKDGKEQKAFVYTTYYDYEEPLILAGFKTVAAK